MGTRVRRLPQPTAAQLAPLMGEAVFVVTKDGLSLHGYLQSLDGDSLVLKDLFRNVQFRKGYALCRLPLAQVQEVSLDAYAPY